MKKIALISIVFLVVAGLIYTASRYPVTTKYVAPTATSTPTRLQRAQILIDALTYERMKDASFVAETEKQIKELHERRERQARLDALTIVQTQIEMEADSLSTKNK